MKKTHSGKNRFGNIRFGAILLSVLLTALSFVIAANAETGAQTAYQYEIQALSTSEVFVDGVKLTEDSITETLESIYDSHLRENALSQKECVYAFASSKEEPEIVVKDSKGREQAVEKREGRYYALRNWDDEVYTEYKDLAEKTMYAVSKYIVGHETIFGALKYVENKSVAFRYLDLYARGGSEKALYDYTYNDVFIGEFVYLSDDSFACTARSTFNTRYSSKGVIVNKINYLLFFRKGPEGWKAYDIVFRPDRAPNPQRIDTDLYPPG